MINVTDGAKGLLRDLLTQAEDESGVASDQVGIRLATTTPGGAETGRVELGLLLDQPREGDQIVEYEGKRVLMADPSVANLLDGVTLDAVDTPEGPRLTVNPS